jgi:hypothetical protein
MDETPGPDDTAVTPGAPDPELADTTAVAIEPEADDGAVEPDGAGSRKGVSKGVLVVCILLAAALAGVAGIVIGWKVEQQRVKDDLANIRPIGTVTAVDDDSMTVNLSSSSGVRTYQISQATIIAGEAGGDTSAVPEGSTVLVKTSGGDDPNAIEVVVFPENTTYGRG